MEVFIFFIGAVVCLALFFHSALFLLILAYEAKERMIYEDAKTKAGTIMESCSNTALKSIKFFAIRQNYKKEIGEVERKKMAILKKAPLLKRIFVEQYGIERKRRFSENVHMFL